MKSTAFATPLTVLRSPLVATPLNTERSASQPSIRFTTRADLRLEPGIPSGQDPQENTPVRYYVPRPKETYENRGFATVLPRTWEGEVSTIGTGDVEAIEKASSDEKRKIAVTPASTGAFLEYAQMVKEDREKALAIQKERSELEQTGRPTCGEKEGKEFVSNYQTILVEGVKAVEYWGVPNGPVPRLFGGQGE